MDRDAGEMRSPGRVRRLLDSAARVVLGPWPLFPGIAFSWMLLLYFMQNFQLALVAPDPLCRISCLTMPDAFAPEILEAFGASLQSQVDLVLVFVNALLGAAAAGLVLWAFTASWRSGDQPPSTRFRYLVALGVAAVASALARVFLANPLVSDVASVGSLVPQTIRSLAALVLIHSLAGILTRRYARIARVAQESLAEVERQQRLVVEADEQARRDVADFLHNRVQAELLVLALDVRRTADGLGPDAASRFTPIVEALERLRSEDVRGAGRRLSPDLDAIGLDTALAELAASWRGAVAVTISWGPETHAVLVGPAVSPEIPRAVYRIVEQALLNAVAHGRAESCRVAVRSTEDGDGGWALHLDIVDDGVGLPDPAPRPGSGWAVIDAWASITGGSWEAVAVETGGVAVRVRIPMVTAVPSGGMMLST